MSIISADSSKPGYFTMEPSKPSRSGPRRQNKDRVKIAKRFLLFGGRGRDMDRCPACRFVITKPVFKNIPGGRLTPMKPELSCWIVQGLTFPVNNNTYCKYHEAKLDQFRTTYSMEEIEAC